ncbi:MAG: AAA family ATPase [Candidatus Caenarcaniphilales bacterium]|jgi:hypothetical protein|nr:AAA family ATPase [Candidatus Caenarcaniphilales bacterium]
MQGANSIPIGEILKRGLSIVKAGAGQSMFQQVVGSLALPVGDDLHRREMSLLEDDAEDPKAKYRNEKFPQKAIRLFKENFAYGDLITLAGIAFLQVSKTFINPNKEPGFVERWLKNIGLIATLGGSSSAIIGRMQGWHRQVALGEEYVNAELNRAERHGRKIFTEYKPAEIQDLITKAKKLDRVLVYEPGIHDSVHERYAKNYQEGQIGGLFDGKPGTGKTDGVRLIMGKWARRLINNGEEPIIAELNLANFDEYLKEKSQKQSQAMALIEAGVDLKLTEVSSFAANQGIMVLELLIRKIQNLVKEVNVHNQKPGVKKRGLVIFIDEFEKAFDARTLKGCDRRRLKHLLLQFNELFVKQNILLTSNRTLEQIRDDIKEHLYVNEQDDGSEIIVPFYDRMASKNRIKVEEPGKQEQALIVAGRILQDYPGLVELKDFGLESFNSSGHFDLDRKTLADAISDQLGPVLRHKMNGRALTYACDDLQSLLLGKARELRLTQNLKMTDEEWDKLGAEDKIKITGAKINRAMLIQTLEMKGSSMYKTPAENDYGMAESIIDAHLAKSGKEIRSNPKIKTNTGYDLDALLNACYKKESRTDRDIYTSNETIIVNDRKFLHYITKHKADLHSKISEPSYTISFAETPSNTKEGRIPFDDFHHTGKITQETLKAILRPSMKKVFENPFTKIIDEVVSGIGKELETSLSNLDPHLVSAAAQGALSALAS